MRYILISLFIFMALGHIHAAEREKYNFNSDWKLKVGDIVQAEEMDYPDAEWKSVTLPHAFNEDEAFKLNIKDLTDTIVWYRKHFRLPADAKGRKVFIEFEGARQGIDLYVNGHLVGQHENGVMAFGFDLTAFVKPGKENVIAARIDNNWDYAEKATGVKYQWSNRNFNANYGGLPKNVWLYVTDKLYQTLPLYSNLKTTGVYIYAEDIQVRARKARIHAESEVKNETKKSQTVGYLVELFDRDGKLVKSFRGEEKKINPGEKIVLSAESEVEGLHFWSWGYGYLYTVKTALCIEGKKTDEVITRTGFRKTRFADGKVWLNDRVIQLKGFAQRTSNEWPAVGMSVPAWLSDYSNGLMVKANANLVRWMHVTPWKQDVESCDRVGLIQAMPAGDAEKDCKGRQWEQRKQVMRDAIIYNRNNPSILFYECGNESISREHMLEMKKIRDEFDYHGGRAIGSREMLDIRDAEYGGEMLYINKSAHHPMWAMEYCRDEGLRKYWDNYSYPYHKDGEGNSAYHSAATGKTKKQADASVYNRNQDSFTIENVIRWFDYWRERPGTGKRVSSGGAKIIFSDTNTHFRGVENYRRSGDTDPMRIPKDSYFAHQVMWDGWVDTENPRLHIVGHWNYEPGVVKPVYVVSNTDSVALFLNGKIMEQAQRDYHFLFTFDKIAFTPGVLEAVGYNDGKEVARMQLRTAGKPAKLKLSAIQNPKGWKADGADLVLLQVEVVDAEGNRCPLANDLIHFTVEGPAEWRGGIAQGPDNYILSEKLPVECGVNRALLRSSVTAGKVVVRAEAEGLASASLELVSSPVEVQNGLSTYIPGDDLEGSLDRGETPLSPSYIDRAVDVAVLSAEAGINTEEACKSFDDNELSEWKNDGKASTAWIKYHLERVARVDEICMKLTGWRMRSYPLEIYAGDELIWSGETEKSLGYVHLKVKPIPASEITIRLKGSSKEDDAFGQIVEVAAPVANELDLFKAKDGDKTNHELRIVEVEFKESLNR
jgi:beta-galactosidase